MEKRDKEIKILKIVLLGKKNSFKIQNIFFLPIFLSKDRKLGQLPFAHKGVCSFPFLLSKVPLLPMNGSPFWILQMNGPLSHSWWSILSHHQTTLRLQIIIIDSTNTHYPKHIKVHNCILSYFSEQSYFNLECILYPSLITLLMSLLQMCPENSFSVIRVSEPANLLFKKQGKFLLSVSETLGPKPVIVPGYLETVQTVLSGTQHYFPILSVETTIKVSAQSSCCLPSAQL